MADDNVKALGYFTRFGLVLKATCVFLPLVAYAGFAFTKMESGMWIALCLFFAGLHWHVITHKGNIKKALKDFNKKELVERVEKLELDLCHANNGIKSRDSLLDSYRNSARDGDLEAVVLAEIASALQAYDQIPSPASAVASLELLRRDLMRLGRGYFNQ